MTDLTMAKIKHYPYTPVLGWSASRYDLFSVCKRKYFYQYYSKYDDERSKAIIARFRPVTTIPLITGTVVHKVIETLLNRLRTTTEDINRSKFCDFVRRETEHQIKSNTFEETVYGTAVVVETTDIAPTVDACLEQFMNSPRFQWLVRDADRHADDWIIDPPGYGESRIGDLKVYCKTDVLFPVGDELHIIDWKTGRPDQKKHRKQLIGYSTWAAHQFSIDPERVKPAIAYLQPAYEEIHETFNIFDMEGFAAQVRMETDEMGEYCRDVENNIPRDKADFPKVGNEAVCTRCKFRGGCFPDRYVANGSAISFGNGSRDGIRSASSIGSAGMLARRVIPS
jgi:hypothetical protein